MRGVVAADAGVVRKGVVGALLLALTAAMFLTAPIAPAEAAPTLSVKPATGLTPAGDAVNVHGSELVPREALAIVQCRTGIESVTCSENDAIAYVDDFGDLTFDGFGVAYDTDAFNECPAGQCVIRVANHSLHTDRVAGNLEGTTDQSMCPAGTHVTGVRGHTGPGFAQAEVVLRAAPVCSDASVGAFVGLDTSGTAYETSACVSGAAVVGLSGHAGDALDSFRAQCQQLEGTTPSGPVTDAEVTAGGAGGTAQTPAPCPTGTVAIGIRGSVWTAPNYPITQIGLVCDNLATARFEINQAIEFYFALDVQGFSVTADQASSPPGTSSIPTRDIPAATIPANRVPFVGATPLRSIDLKASPLRSIPLRSIPLRSIPLRSIPLRSIMLSSIPLRSITWAAILDGTPFENVPLQTVSLQDVLDDQTASGRFEALDLASVDLSATPLRSISVLSLAMGTTPLRSIPLRSIDTGDSPDLYAEWCAFLADLPDPVICADEGFTPDTPIMALDLAGVPLRSIPLRSIPLRSIPLRSIDLEASPLRSIPLRSIAVSNTPLRSIPLRSIDMASTPLRSIPLHSIAIADTPLRSIPLRSIDLTFLQSLLNCQLVDCASTTLQLGDVLSAIRTDSAATLGGLLGALVNDADAGTLGALFAGLAEDADIGTLGQLIDAVWNNPDIDLGTLGDILMGLVLARDFPWEDLPLVKMAAHRYGSTTNTIRFRINYDVVNGMPVADHTVTATLPPGFAYDIYGPAPLIDESAGRIHPTITGDPDTGERLTWQLDGAPRGAREVVFDAVAGLRVGSGGGVSASVNVTDGRTIDAANGSGPTVGVTAPATDETFDSPRGVSHNTLEFGYITDAEDSDFFRIPAPPSGSRLQIRLSHLSADADLVLYRPVADSSEDTPTSTPLRSIPLRSIPLEDEQLRGEAVPPETLQDIPLRSIPLRSISANRSTADEEIDITSTSLSGDYTLQVSGYNGATSDDPYVLRVTTTSPPEAPECTNGIAVDDALIGQPSADNAGAETLILLNEQRLHAAHAGDAAAVRARLDTLAAHAAVNGHVLPVDSIAAVRDAYDAWDAAACSPAAANGVVRAITAAVDAFAQTHPALKNVVLIGGDDLLPMARVDDTTSLSNERDYAGDVAGPNPLTGAFATEHILSDDPYGDRDPVPWLNRLVYVPDLAVGRLVESPADIIGQVDQFIASNGRLDPQTALTTGYDFLTDGTQAVTDELAADLGGGSVDSLISETWTSTNVIDALFPADGSPDIASVNAHYDHYRSLPADQNAQGIEEDLFTIADIPASSGATSALAGRILFTMGCHAGLAVPNTYNMASGQSDDWAQTFSAQRAIYVANTGFGYGDTETVALSERLMTLFADNMKTTRSVGAALVEAKNEYFASMGVYGSYDEKALQEATFYGLPMYSVDGAVVPPAVPDTATENTRSVTLTPTFASDTTDRGRFWSVGGDVQVTHYRPIQPRTSIDVTRQGKVAHGAVIEHLESGDIVGVDPVFARPTVDLAANEPEIESTDVVFPTSLQTISTVGQGTALEQRLVVMPGQFFGIGDSSTTGVQRLFTKVKATVLYRDASSASEFVPPTIERISATSSSTTASFTAEVSDPDGGSGVSRVLVLFRDTSNIWKKVELSEGGGAWTGSAGSSSDAIEYFVQAVDNDGNVAQSTNKGRYFHAVTGTGGEGEVIVPDPTPLRFFHGFQSPVNINMTNVMKAGAAVPVKWQLRYDDGSFERSLTGIQVESTTVDCTNTSTDVIEQTLDTSSTSLTYDTVGEKYELKWKTQKSWAGTCRRLTISVPYMGTRSAVFKFK